MTLADPASLEVTVSATVRAARWVTGPESATTGAVVSAGGTDGIGADVIAFQSRRVLVQSGKSRW